MVGSGSKELQERQVTTFFTFVLLVQVASACRMQKEDTPGYTTQCCPLHSFISACSLPAAIVAIVLACIRYP